MILTWTWKNALNLVTNLANWTKSCVCLNYGQRHLGGAAFMSCVLLCLVYTFHCDTHIVIFKCKQCNFWQGCLQCNVLQCNLYPRAPITESHVLKVRFQIKKTWIINHFVGMEELLLRNCEYAFSNPRQRALLREINLEFSCFWEEGKS